MGETSEEQKSVIKDEFQLLLPAIKTPRLEDLIILGAPVGEDAIIAALVEKTSDLKRMCLRLENIDAHHVFFLFKNSFSLPKLLYTFRTSPCFKRQNLLAENDDTLYSGLEKICNVRLDSTTRLETSLPDKMAGLGLGSAVRFAVSCYLASVSSFKSLCNGILGYESVEPLKEEAVDLWFSISGLERTPNNSHFQKSWSDPINKSIYDTLVNESDDTNKLRIISAEGKLQAGWINPLPCRSLGLKLTDVHLRISIAMRLGLPICEHHTCKCDQPVDKFGTHGLSCRRSVGRIQRHAMTKDIIKRALGSVNIPSVLEHPGLATSDNKRPDGLTWVPWERGMCFIWDVTVVGALAPSRISNNPCQFSAATEAEMRKISKYSEIINRSYIFAPVAFEVQCGCAPVTYSFLRALGKRLLAATQEPKSTLYLRQRISVALQVGNSASVLGTIEASDGLDGIFVEIIQAFLYVFNTFFTPKNRSLLYKVGSIITIL